MTRVPSVALVGLLVATSTYGTAETRRAPAPTAQDPTPAQPTEPGEPAPRAIVPLQPVPAEHTCVYFDEREMRGRLLDPDLAAREVAFDELVRLCHQHPEIRATVNAWARESSTLELAWTARLALREWNAELRRALANAPQTLHIQVQQAQPWQDPYLRDALLSMGLDPTQYRVRGRMTLSQDELARMGLALPEGYARPDGREPGGGDVGNGRFDGDANRGGSIGNSYGPIEATPVLGVVCDEARTDRVVLTRVVSGSIADAIGLAAGDRLVRIGDHDLTAPSDIDEAMHAWSERGPEGPDALEIVALDGDGQTKVLVWTGSR